MKKCILLFMIASLSGTAWANERSERVGDFALIDHRGDFHQMNWYQDHTAVVMLSTSSHCTQDAAALRDYAELSARFENTGVAFLLLNSDGDNDRTSVEAKMTEMGFDFPVLMDDSQLVSETFGIVKTGEYVVYDPSEFSMVHRGNHAAAVETVLMEMERGFDVSAAPVQTSLASGCDVQYRSYEDSSGIPSYVNDVAPILIDNCATCHRDGGVAPFAMDSHLMVKGWSPMMRETLMTKRMPPGQVDSHIGEVDALGLSDREIQTLVHWIDVGSPEDGDSDPLAQLSWNESKWPLGEPDMIVRVPATEIPASGAMPYIWVDSGVVMPEDRWMRGAQLLPGDPSVVHHVVSVAVPPDMSGPRIGICPNPCATGDQNPNEDGVRLQGYVPGINPSLMNSEVGTLIEAGSRFVFQMHYTTSGKETLDASEFGIYFHPEGFEPSRKRIQAAALDNKFLIPANAENHAVESSFTLPVEAYVTSVSPHMHVRGKSMRFVAQFPDGSNEELLSIPHYDFNWQRNFTFKEKKLFPAGTKILVTGAFDNSVKNRANPAPNESVRWGDQSWEEMFIGFIGLEISQR
ncbi:MAG: peroxiredoxin [Kiritimatiellia bacterium]|jgi:peroxiredoxin